MNERAITPEQISEQVPKQTLAHPIIFFDGVCGMCNAFVNVVMRLDRKGVFRFAPLQGETAKKMLPPLDEDPRLWSTTLVDDDGLHDESDAPFLICQKLGGVWRVVALLRFIPRWIRNPVYRVIARSRYSWSGKKEACRIPTPQERERFLD